VAASEKAGRAVAPGAESNRIPLGIFQRDGIHSASVTQKTYNGVAILPRSPIEIVGTTLLGGEADSHARFLEVMIEKIRIVNIYIPNANPGGTAKFEYKLRIRRLSFCA